MKGENCKWVIEELLPDMGAIEVSMKGKPLRYVSRKYGWRVALSDGLRRALKGILVQMGDAAPPVQVCSRW